ncbi:unnamed protein product [Blepharisma stoltei]|uniref:Kelch motif family protein n=1 Tax=Blepharisma stoltei TaxID=1481888 RepID=A0AAU9IU97_9CILI|nr:unnamed protein product [Blepharisma stoltei]
METSHCYKFACENKPTFLCHCAAKGCFICKNHLSEHIEDSSVSHNPKSLYEKPDPDSKILIYSQLIQIDESLGIIEHSIIEQAAKFIQKVTDRMNRIIEKINLTRKECTNLILKIIETAEIYNEDGEIFKIMRLKPDQALLEFDILKKEKIILPELNSTIKLGNSFQTSLDLIDSIFRNSESSNMTEKNTSFNDTQQTSLNITTENKQKYLQALKPFLSHIVGANFILEPSFSGNEEEKEQRESEKLFYFKDQTKILASIDLSTMETSEKSLSIPEEMCTTTSMCLLPYNSIFCYGNWQLSQHKQKPFSGIAFIIDCKQNVLRCQDGYPCINAGSIYHNGEIYIFGGNDGKDLDIVRSFNLKEKKWMPRGSMLSPSSTCSCEFFQGKIYVAGWNHSKIHSFCPYTGFHDTLDLSIVQRTNKVILASEERLYLIESNGVIYESWVNDLSNWMSVGIFEDKGRYSNSYKYVGQKSAFFMISGVLFKFDFSSKSILKLK